MNSTVKTSVSIQKDLWEFLKVRKNRSGVINMALKMFFEKEDFLEKADQEYWQVVGDSLRGKKGDYMAINSNGETVDNDLLEKNLWN